MSTVPTLAARALSWAEEAFPVFAVPRVVDPAPLVPRRSAIPLRPEAAPVAAELAHAGVPLGLLAGLTLAAVLRTARPRSGAEEGA